MKKFSRTSRLWRNATALLGTAAIVGSLAACSGNASPGGDDSSAAAYKVGVLVGLTGSYAALGDPEQKAIKLYFDDLNKQGGIDGHKVELVPLDSGSDEGTAVNQLRKLAIEDNVVAVLGPSSSGESIALQSFTKSLKVPTIALASSSSIVDPPDKSTYIFKQYSGTNESLKAQLEFAKSQGWTKVALLHTNDGYGQDPAKRITGLVSDYGIELTGSEAFDATATDVTAQLGKLATGNPDAVLVWAVNPANAVVAKSAQSISFKPVLFNSPGAGSADYIKNGGDAVNGTYLEGSVVLAPASLTKDSPQYEVTHKLVDAYKSAYNAEAGQYAANGWDGSILLENAIRKAGVPDPSDLQSTRDAIRKALETQTKDVVGVNAIYTFTPDFHGSTSLGGLAILNVEDGAFAVAKTF